MNSLQRWFTAFRRSAHRSVHQISLREDTFNAPSASFQIPILHFHIRFQKDAIEALHCKCNAVERSVIKMNRDCVGQWCQRVLHHHTNSILPEWTAPPSLFSPSVVDSYIFFCLDAVFVPPLCISAKFTPFVDVAGLGNEKLKLHVRQRRAPPLLFFLIFFCLQTWTEKKRGKKEDNLGG